MAHDNQGAPGSNPEPSDHSGTGDIHDDDALADALAAEYRSMATAAIPVVSPHAESTSGGFEEWLIEMLDVPEAAGSPEAQEVPLVAEDHDAGGTIEAADAAVVPPSSEPSGAAATESAGQDRRASFVSPFDPPTSTVDTPDIAAAPWSLFPAPDPSQAVALADGPPPFLAESPVEQWPAPSFDEPAEANQPAPEVVSTVPNWSPAPPQPPDAAARPDAAEVAPESTGHGDVHEGEPGSSEQSMTQPAPQPAVSAWTAWAPHPVGTSEWDAAAAPIRAVNPETLVSDTADSDAAIEPSESLEPSAPESEEFPWNATAVASAAAAATVPPLVTPVPSDRFNWSISANGKVANLAEGAEDAAEQQGAVVDSRTPGIDSAPEVEPPTEPNPEPDPQSAPDTVAEAPAARDDAPWMFSPPPLVEPQQPQSAQVQPDLPSAPPPYLPVGTDMAPDGFERGTSFDLDGGASPTTGSISVTHQPVDDDLDDDVDDTDRIFASLLSSGGEEAAATSALAAPSGPIATVRIAEDESVFFDDEPTNLPLFSLEHAGLEPTPLEHRAGYAVRLFWIWFSANSSIVSVALGAAVFATGMSLRQSIVAILGGVALSFFPLALTTLAGKRSGQPTMVVSRATFGLMGNLVPAVLAVVSRLFWGALLLWLLAASVGAVLVGTGIASDIEQLSLIVLAIAFIVALAIAFVGYALLQRIQLFLTIIAMVSIVGLVVLTADNIDIPQALTIADGSWVHAVGGAVLVFSVVGLVWAFSGADAARYQRPSSSGASSMLSSSFGAAIPAFVLIGYGALLAASDRTIATGFTSQPIQTLANILPGWYPIPLIAATALSLLSGVVLTMYSGGLAAKSAGLTLPRPISTVIVGAILLAVAVLITVTATAGIGEVFRDFATTLAVPTAAWMGIFGSEMMIRNRRFDSESLLKRGGVYSDVRWVNLVGLVVISAVGFGLTTATVNWLSWQGYLFSVLGLPLDSDIASTDVGVLAALVLGVVLPLAAGVPAIRRQELRRA